ncbi:MAG TPA: hypothetical protein VJL29_03380 [Thermoguttaceae bacterium]|nr:hypothetical protein [Thermoguttaceae bacterium]
MVLRQILHCWLGPKVREAVRREVGQAAAGESGCDVGVVFALEIEGGGFVDLLEQTVTIRGKTFTARRGTLQARRVVAITSGAGLERAREATEALIDAHRPTWVISAGFAGGLSDALGRHDLVVADSVVGPSGERVTLDLPFDPNTLGMSVHVGALLTVEKIVRRPEEKRGLGERFGAAAVDTETAVVAEVCRQRGVPVAAVRVLTDAVDETLPPDVQRLTDQTTTAARLGAALGTVWRRPKSVKDLWALNETALVGSDRLAKCLVRLVETLVPVAGQHVHGEGSV